MGCGVSRGDAPGEVSTGDMDNNKDSESWHGAPEVRPDAGNGTAGTVTSGGISDPDSSSRKGSMVSDDDAKRKEKRKSSAEGISQYASMTGNTSLGRNQVISDLNLFNQKSLLQSNLAPQNAFAKILEEHRRFLISFVAVLDHDAVSLGITDGAIENFGTKPKIEDRQFKSHTMDNVRVRKMCDELLHLEDTGHKMEDKDKSGTRGWMKTLQISVGNHVHSIKLANNPEIKIGGYFIISQMLSYIRGLISLDLSSNELTAAEARVLAIGLKLNSSVQELRMKENSIGSEGATSLADALKVNKTLLLVDLRMNSIRGPGICMLADSVQENRTLTSLDLRWNYAGESSDFVETALLDLKRFCFRNMKHTLNALKRTPMPAGPVKSSSIQSGKRLDLPESPLAEERNGVQPHSQANGDAEVSNIESGDPDSESQASTHASHDRAKSESLRKPKEVIEASVVNYPAEEEEELDDQDEQDDQQIGSVEVTIMSAKNLPQVIWTTGKDGEFLGLPQAYTVCSLGKSVYNTKIKKKGWNPKWDFTCTMGVQSIWNVCTVKVMHSKSTTARHRDDYTIGTVNLPVGSIVNWRGVAKDLDGTWRAYHKPATAARGDPYLACEGKDKHGSPTNIFETAEAAAMAYDEQAHKLEGERAVLNMAGESRGMIGLHVKEEQYPLVGEDGVDVIGVQAGVYSAIRLRIKYFSRSVNYLELHLERASCLPKMDAGLGTCDAYAIVIMGDYHFRSRVVKNSLDPQFNQWFRVGFEEFQDDMECRVQIWDWDRIGDDDHMGDAVAKVPKEKMLVPGALDGSYGIINSDGMDYVKNGKGERSSIHLKFVLYKAVEPIT
mmetsp:Transcript_25090/g.51003  ORF Transcript_25090/g.51003 Transcript_25090/m.51003 type:complete len:839 (-) Transcript_25090:34-2550(-)|eukprot:CAMPEP_0181295776 /NCGR_PEP_ID=MMETSP1101-20121128/4333_1 /TAXON_ID=46948 /ORGANISM="Rhodomonas abbreviata, Strain Caron Lab Isolate" /LENGTH=838 /DNA_ID=CAMNT_0023400561 /DNA_START=408 /DNA_END=2924 /DNA_ORIENTATION=+